MQKSVYTVRFFARDAFLGLVFGFVFLHPASMVIFRWLDPHFAGSMGGMHRQDIWGPVLDSFLPGMFPMGLVYGLLCGALAVVGGYQHFTIMRQRDVLARELQQNVLYQAELRKQATLLKEQNEQLARLERSGRRTAQFMAHDLKTHMGCILGFTNLLIERREDPPTGEILTALQRIRRQAHQMMGEIGDLLDFARLGEAGILRREQVRAAELLVEAATDFSLPEHKGQVSIGELATGSPSMWADRRLLRRVLTNLLSNALRHNPPGTHVVLGARFEKNSDSIIFSCRDDGAGIPRDVLAAIFGDAGVHARANGDTGGLGLAFCRAAVSAHGGRIWCESREEEGTCVFFAIPRGKENEDGKTGEVERARPGRRG